MTEVWTLAAVWIGLALLATLLAIAFRISTALSEIVVGTVAQLAIGGFVGTVTLGAKAPWITFLSGTGAIVLTFLAGAAAVLPAASLFRYPQKERFYTTMMMSTGLTFGTISALFGLSHGIITQIQYSYLVATVIGSAVIPTMIGNAYFLPGHLLTPIEGEAVEAAAEADEMPPVRRKGAPR